MSANFTPNQNDYENLTPFKSWLMCQINTWGQTNFPFVESDFDELTNYGMLMKMMNALNDVIANENMVEQDVTNLFTAFTELQSYVNDYFDNLDVQDEINNKLDEMVEDGTMETLLAPYLQSFNQRLDSQDTAIENFTTQFTANLTAETTARTTADNALETQISTIVASAGTAGDSSSEIVQARTNIRNALFTSLNDRINFIEKSVPFVYTNNQNGDFNQFVTPGKYLIYGTTSNGPTRLQGTGVLIVEAMNPDSSTAPTTYQWIVQTWYTYHGTAPNGFASRIIQRTATDPVTYIYGEWSVVDYGFLGSLYNSTNKIIRSGLADCYATNGLITASTDLNDLLKEGNYLLTNATANLPSTNPVLLITNQCNDLGITSNNWVVQTARDIRNSEIYQRVIMYTNLNPSGSIYNDWRKLYPVENGNVSLAGKKIVNFGDSIFGNFRGATSVSAQIANVCGATTYNVGFGGCQMSNRSGTTWNAFSMCNLADAVADQDFTMQDTAVADTSWSDKPNYFDTHLATLKSIDFDEIDIVTIAYGTNDYTAGDLLDNENNKKDVSTFAGALRYSIETLLTAYPHLKIVIGSPLFRLWLNDGVVQYTSDTRTYAGGYNLQQMTDKVKDIGKEYHCQVIDAYNDFGVNQFNWERIFDSNDTTHPNETGRALLGRLYGIELLK